MTFSLYQGRVVMSSQIAHTQSFNKHPLAHILDTSALIFSSCALLQFTPTASCDGIPPSTGDNHQSTGGRSERTQGWAKMAEWNSISYICTRALHSFLSFAHRRATSTVIPLWPKATFTPSIQPILGLPLASCQPILGLPLTSAINTILAIRYSLHMPKPSQYSLIRSTG